MVACMPNLIRYHAQKCQDTSLIGSTTLSPTLIGKESGCGKALSGHHGDKITRASVTLRGQMPATQNAPS